MSAGQNRAYHDFFSTGQRVGIGILVPDQGIFREWGGIERLDEDLLEVRLSRTQIPEGASLEIGSTIMVRTGKNGEGYSCTAIVVGEKIDGLLPVRLTGEVVNDNQREFYRLDVFLPLTYGRTPEASPAAARERWEKQQREREFRKRWEEAVSPEIRAAVAGNEALLPPEELGHPLPIAANISGNGLLIRVHELCQPGDLVDLRLYLPPPRRSVVDIVAEVVHVTPVAEDGGEPLYSTAMRYLCIDRPDQDRIIAFIRNEEREQLRLMGGRLLVETKEPALTPRQWFWHVTRQVIGTLVTLYIIWYVAMILVNYQKYGPRSYIQKTFEQQIMQYVRKLKSGN